MQAALYVNAMLLKPNLYINLQKTINKSILLTMERDADYAPLIKSFTLQPNISAIWKR